MVEFYELLQQINQTKEQVIGTSDPLSQISGDNLDLRTDIWSAEVVGKSCRT